MIGQTVAELLDEHVGLDIEGIDRLYLNLYQPRLQTGGGVVGFFRGHRGAQVARATALRGAGARQQGYARQRGLPFRPWSQGGKVYPIGSHR